MFKINQDQETGKIKSLHLMDVTFSILDRRPIRL